MAGPRADSRLALEAGLDACGRLFEGLALLLVALLVQRAVPNRTLPRGTPRHVLSVIPGLYFPVRRQTWKEGAALESAVPQGRERRLDPLRRGARQ